MEGITFVMLAVHEQVALTSSSCAKSSTVPHVTALICVSV